MGEVGLDGSGDRPVTQVGEGGLLPRLALAAVDAQLGDTAGVHGGGGEPAAGADLGQLVVVTDQQHPAPGGDLAGDDRFEGADVGHPRLVHHQQRPRLRGVVAAAPLVEQRVQRPGRDAGTGGQLDRRPGRRGRPDHPMAGLLERGADGVEGERLAGPGRADQHRHRLRRRGDRARRRPAGRRPATGRSRLVRRRARGAGRTGPVRSRRRGTGPRPRPARGSSTAPAPRPGGDGEHLVGGEDPVGDPLDRLHRRAVALPGGDGPDQVGVGERRRRWRSARCAAGRRSTPPDRRPARRARGRRARRTRPCRAATTRRPRCRRAAGTSPRAARRHPVPTRPRRPRPSSPRRSVRARPRACGAGWPAPPPGDPPGVSGVPVAASHASTSCDRFENPSSSVWGMPAISGTWRPGRHSTPSDAVSSSRNTAWNTSPAARAWRYRSAPNRALHRPSAPFGHVGDEDVPVQQRDHRPGRCDAGTPPPPPPTSPAGAARRRARRRGRPATPGCGSRAAP